MKPFHPMLFTTLRSYSKETFVKDLISGIIVAIIALPLSIALALASGVGPEEGLYTAIIAGFLISAFGGSTVQISGPTAAFATIVAGIVATYGLSGLALATLMAGIILIIMGLCKFGNLIKFIPYTITTGFTAGIAVTILIGQLKDFMGLTFAPHMSPVETMEKLECVILSLPTLNLWAVLVGAICLVVLVLWPKVSKRIPGSLIAVLVGIALVKFLDLPVNTIGDLYEVSSALPKPQLPDFSINMAVTIAPEAFTIAILAAIESLLSCVVADGMTNTKHRSNTELIAQGIGNMGSALMGGIPATGAIARTAANINNGGKTPISGMVHALVLMLILVVLMPYAALIPMPTIAAILFQVAYNMCQWRPFLHLVKTAPKSDVLVLVLTFALTVIFDLVVAIEVGLLLACLLFMKRMSEETEVRGWKYAEDEKEEDPFHPLLPIPKDVRVYDINGPLFFGAAGRIADISVKTYTKVLILRMGGVPAIDATAMNSLDALRMRCEKQGIELIFSHLGEQPMRTMIKFGMVDKMGLDHFCPHLEDALRLARKVTGEHSHV
ncbi:MAG: STAS domain-containing protein [Ruminiclostridium sp.]|nr:STAS domain-containing protein [Ruminiclostridium sp.]MBQ9933489.1 STAS domain-containing protein [Ruminiclostridium sp.]